MRRSRPRTQEIAALMALMAWGAAAPAGAQETQARGAAALLEKRVSLNLERARLTQALKSVMEALDANYTLDQTLQNAVVTAKLTNVPARVALNTLLNAANPPATYRLEDDIFAFAPRAASAIPETITAVSGPEPKTRPVVEKITLRFIDPADIVPLFGGTLVRLLGQNFGIIPFDALQRGWNLGAGGGANRSQPGQNRGFTGGGFGSNGFGVLGSPGSGPGA